MSELPVLIDAADADDPLPLPLLVARKWNFPLAYYDQDGQPAHYLYAVQDWIKGIAQTEQPRKFWNDVKRRAKAVGVELSARCGQLPYVASNGKTYQMDHTDAETLYYIAQRMDAETGLREAVLRYLAKAGVNLDVQRIEGQDDAFARLKKAEQDYVQAQITRGMSEDEARLALIERRQGKEDFKVLMALVQSVVSDAPQYAKLVDTEYMAIFGHIARELERILQTKSIRDALPPLQYSYVRTAELALTELLKRRDHMTMAAIVHAAKLICIPLGEHLQEVCRVLSIDHVTGRPLLKDEND